MQIFRFAKEQKPELVDAIEALPEEGFAWLDFVREDNPDWKAEVHRLTACDVHDAHIIDSFNDAHPTFYDGTDAYDMIIFRGLASSDVDSLEARPTAFFIFGNLLVTVRSRDSTSVGVVSTRLLDRAVRAPKTTVELVLMVLNTMVDRFMAMREPLTEQLEEWQEALLDPSNPFDDWMALMRHRSRLRRLERMCEAQAETLETWREDTSHPVAPLRVRINDLGEHIRRVLAHAQHLEAQLEALVQLHFAAVAHRTNEIVRVLTVLTAVFLPLTLIAGIFGMNFENMPELKIRYAYFVALGCMLLLGLGALWLFRRKRWI